MKKFVAASIIATASLLSASQASADWQYTHWGMSPEEVVKASQGIASSNLTSNEASGGFVGATNLLVAPYQSGDYSFRAVFAFNEKRKLMGVSLLMQNPSAGIGLASNLQMKYGKPISRDVSPTSVTTIWRTDTDQIMLNAIGTLNYRLDYRSLMTDANKGL